MTTAVLKMIEEIDYVRSGSLKTLWREVIPLGKPSGKRGYLDLMYLKAVTSL